MNGRPRVYTARLGAYTGLDALDITRGTGRGVGLAFAPSEAILTPALAARRRAKELRDHPLLYPDPVAEADRIEAEAWARYEPAYLAEMRRSYIEQRDAWNLLLVCPLVTLCCYCTDPEHCHRTLLARVILPKLGCAYAGERPSQVGKALADKLMDSVDEERALRGGAG